MTIEIRVGDASPDPWILDQDGTSSRLSTFWAERPAVLAFLRHFG